MTERLIRPRLLTDETTSQRLVSACRRLVKQYPIVHIADWRDGSWLGLDDAALLMSCAEARLVLIAFDRLPKPFETVIPNAAAIAAATEPGPKPATFAQKYGYPFSGYFEALCDEMTARLRVLPGDASARAAAEAAPAVV